MSNEKLKIIRKAKKLNQHDFSQLLGIKQAYYSELELGKKPITEPLQEKIFESVGVSKVWWELSTGDIFSDKVSTNSGGGNVVYNDKKPPKSNKYSPYTLYLHLNEKELDFEISLQIEVYRDVYSDWKKLIEVLHCLNPPQFLKDKFQLLPSFEDYRKKSEDSFSEDHSHITDKITLKILKIVDLYSDSIDYIRSMISKLIEYLHSYSELILTQTVRDTVGNESVLGDEKKLERNQIKGKN